jgi:hypothetical protein
MASEPGIRVGQTWRDRSNQALNRTVQIEHVNATTADGVIRSDDRNPRRVGRNTSIPRTNLNGIAWVLVSEPEQPTYIVEQSGHWFTVKHAQHGGYIARWDGTPARWATHDEAASDAERLGRGEKPQQCSDLLRASTNGEA